MIKNKIKILNFYGIFDVENYTLLKTNASNLKIQHKITGKILDFRY